MGASFVKRVQPSASRYTGRRSMWQTSHSCALSRGPRASFSSWVLILGIRSGSMCSFSDVYRISWICCQLMNPGTKYVFLFFPCHSTPLDDLLAPCYVLHKNLIFDTNLWTTLGEEYLYYLYRFSQRSPASWNEREVLAENAGVGCNICAYELQAHIADVLTFAEEAQTQKLRAFGIFAGAGAMSLGMENATGGMGTTRAVEISPSAARTFRHAPKGLPRGEPGDVRGRASSSEVFF